VDPAEDHVLAPGPTTITRGDLFTLDRHRLLCGDATDPGDVARLLGDVVPVVMTTDPPYGVEYDPSWRHRAYPQQQTAVGSVSHDTTAAWPAAFQLFPGTVVYAWHAARATATVATTLETTGFVLRAQIIWVKQHFALSRGDYHWQHEPCWYAVRKGAASQWQGDRTQSTVWTVPNLNAMGGTRTADNAPTGQHAKAGPPVRNQAAGCSGVTRDNRARRTDGDRNRAGPRAPRGGVPSDADGRSRRNPCGAQRVCSAGGSTGRVRGRGRGIPLTGTQMA
jgi:hypothetical protein